MALTSVDAMIAAYATAQRLVFMKAATAQSAGQWSSFWGVAGQPGAGVLSLGNTSPGVVPTSATSGAPTLNAFGEGNTGYIASAFLTAAVNGIYCLADRLYHVGSFSLGLGANVVEDAPSYVARLPSSDFSCTQMWLEMATTNGAYGSVITVGYTNEQGVSGRSATLDNNISGYAFNRMLPFRLQSGDLGVQQVNSVTVTGVAGTGTFNVVVSRLLSTLTVYGYAGDSRADIFKLGMPTINQDSCLWMYATAGGTGPVPISDFVIING